jgi:glycosyltransferase involved in cell wall biosynthesis
VVNSVTGLGYLFISNKWTTKFLRSLILPFYKKILQARRSWIIFENSDDLDAFTNSGLVNPAKASLIKGSGVDTAKFSPPEKLSGCKEQIVLFAARLLVDKGILDFIEAAKIIRIKNITVKFIVAGDTDDGNPSSITKSLLNSLKEEKIAEFLGHVDNIEAIINTATIVVLPSYREGTPKILLEAAAMGKPIIATDVPGCREIVEHGKNGLLVPVNDPQQLAAGILKLLEDENLRQKMGAYSREKAVKEFDSNHVAQHTVAVYKKVGIELFPVM